MDPLTFAKLITVVGFGGMAFAEYLSYARKNAFRKVDSLAKSKFKDSQELNNNLGNDGLRISKTIQLTEKTDMEGVVIFGSTGSGKTTSFFFPNLLSNDLKGSIIVTDPKGELYELTSKYQQDVCKRKVYKMDLMNPDYSEKYNLLENCKDSTEVLQLASSLLFNGSLSVELATGKKAGGIEWIQMAEPLLAAALFYVKTLEYPYNNIEFAFQLLITLDSEKLGLLFQQSKDLDCMTQFNIFKQVGGADRTEGSVKITLSSNMKLFTDRNINKIASKTTFNIEKFREEPSILYISYPERKSSYLAPFTAPFFSQIIDKLLDSHNKKSNPIHLLFEEFCNIGSLNNMSINCSTVRSRKISISICLQSITQLFQVYGKDNAMSILNNLKTKIILPGMNDIETLKYIATLCGDTEISTRNISINNKDNNVSESYHKQRRKLFEDGELRTLEDNEMLVLVANKQPILDLQEVYYRESKYTDNVSDKPVKVEKRYSYMTDLNKELEKIKKDLELLEQQEDVEDAKGLFTRKVQQTL